MQAMDDPARPKQHVRDRASKLIVDCLAGDTAFAARIESTIFEEHSRRYEAVVRRVLQHLRRQGNVASSNATVNALVQGAMQPHGEVPSTGKRQRALGPRKIMQAPTAQQITPPMAQDTGKFAMVVPAVFNSSECEELIRATEARGYVPATMRTLDDDAVMMPHVRDNHRVVWKDEARAAMVWDRLKLFVPPMLRGQIAVGVNPMFRFYRYDAGQSFAKHTDDPPYCTPTGEASMLTCIIYLNERFEGGATRLCTYAEMDEGAIDIVPTTGAAFLFEHSLLHSSTPIAQGTDRKYAMRTDVMYRFPPRITRSRSRELVRSTESTNNDAA